MNQRVALFGGSFDPPHLAHQMAARWALENKAVDQVLWVPCAVHAFGKTLASFAHRLEMSRLAAAELGDRVEVSSVEAEIGGESRTLQTLQHLRQARPHVDWSILIGSDLLGETQHWMGYQEITRVASFLVVGRSGYASDASSSAPILPAISSSEIRRCLGQNEDVTELLPASVLDYIRKHRLYGT